jgi:hypothetical protein
MISSDLFDETLGARPQPCKLASYVNLGGRFTFRDGYASRRHLKRSRA